MEDSIPYDNMGKGTFNSGTSPNRKHMANLCTIQNERELIDNWKETTVIKTVLAAVALTKLTKTYLLTI